MALVKNEDVYGPSSQPGMRAAVAHIVAERDQHDIVLALHPEVFVSLKYYARHHCHPQLIAALGDRRATIWRTSHLQDTDYVVPDDISARRVWLVSYSASTFTAAELFRIPGHWNRSFVMAFDEEYSWQSRVILQCFEVGNVVDKRTNVSFDDSP